MYSFINYYLLYSFFEKNNDENVLNNTSYVENVVDQNEIESENIVEENETVENTISTEENTEPNNSVSKVPSSSVYESNTDLGTTDKKQEAINLVKEKWGEDDTVNFRCDSVTTDGEYIIAVVSLQTASVKSYFRVNLENKTVEIDY